MFKIPGTCFFRRKKTGACGMLPRPQKSLGWGVPLGRKQMEASFLPGEGKNDTDLERMQIPKTMEASFLPREGNNDADLERIQIHQHAYKSSF